MKTIAIIPAYNESKTIGRVVEVAKRYVDQVIVVDDGSNDNTGELANKCGVLVYQHFINRGLGAALSTGLKAALLNGADIIITIDADGQHLPSDILKLIEPILQKKADIVIGKRRFSRPDFSKVSIWFFIHFFYNFFANLVTFVFFRLWIADSQSGLRAFNKKVALSLEITTNGMEVSSEIIGQIKKHGWRLQFVPIPAIYTSYSLSKGQNLILGFKTLWQLIVHKFI